MQLTNHEDIFLKYLKKELRFTNITIKKKISIEHLCNERPDVPFVFGKEQNNIKDILIDLVLYKDGKPFAGIEIIDEPEEFENARGEKLLIDFIFKSLGYEYFRIVDLDKLEEASVIIKNRVLTLTKIRKKLSLNKLNKIKL